MVLAIGLTGYMMKEKLMESKRAKGVRFDPVENEAKKAKLQEVINKARAELEAISYPKLVLGDIQCAALVVPSEAFPFELSEENAENIVLLMEDSNSEFGTNAWTLVGVQDDIGVMFMRTEHLVHKLSKVPHLVIKQASEDIADEDETKDDPTMSSVLHAIGLMMKDSGELAYFIGFVSAVKHHISKIHPVGTISQDDYDLVAYEMQNVVDFLKRFGLDDDDIANVSMECNADRIYDRCKHVPGTVLLRRIKEGVADDYTVGKIYEVPYADVLGERVNVIDDTGVTRYTSMKYFERVYKK